MTSVTRVSVQKLYGQCQIYQTSKTSRKTHISRNIRRYT